MQGRIDNEIGGWLARNDESITPSHLGYNHALGSGDWKGATDEMQSMSVLDADGRDGCLASAEGLWPIESVRVHFVHDASVWERPE